MSPKEKKEKRNWLAEVLLKLLIEGILPNLMEMAKGVVQQIQEDPGKLTDDEKRKKAFKEIEKKAKAEGIKAGANLINLAIEVAVASLKK
jgi:hypothetical protein